MPTEIWSSQLRKEEGPRKDTTLIKSRDLTWQVGKNTNPQAEVTNPQLGPIAFVRNLFRTEETLCPSWVCS